MRIKRSTSTTGSRRLILFTSAVATSLLLVGGFVVPAHAEEDSSAASEAIAQVAPELGAIVQPQFTNSGAILADSSSFDVEIPTTGNGQVTVGNDGVELFAIGLPDAASGATAESNSDGTVVYQTDSVDTAVQVLENDSIRLLSILNNRAAPDTFEYALPEGIQAHPNDDGSLSLQVSGYSTNEAGDVVEDEIQIATVESPWAFDATGADVSTSYIITESGFQQTVSPGKDAVYPIVADPTITRTSGMVILKFSRAETATISSMGWAASGFAATCGGAGALLGPAVAIAAGAACLAVSGLAVYTAGVAQNSSPKKCLWMFMAPGGATPLIWFAPAKC